MKFFTLAVLFILMNLAAFAKEPVDENALKQTLFTLQKGEELKEITADILAQDGLPSAMKEKFFQQKRKFFVFTYPSDGLKIKSMLSFVSTAESKPLIMILRGGSDMLGLPAFLYPSKEVLFAAESDAVTVSACYRGGVSEGADEYGGADVNDVFNLSQHLPKIAEKFGLKYDKKYMIGISRGGLEMFLALAKFPQLQKEYQKFVSFSGVLNTDLFIANNPEWREKEEKHYGFKYKSWLDERNPVLAVPKIANKDLPFLLIQGTSDPKVALDEGYSMLKQMRKHQLKNISYWEVEGGDHVLKNHPEYIKLILAYLESNQ